MIEFTEIEIAQMKEQQVLRQIKSFKRISMYVIVYGSFFMVLFTTILVLVKLF